MPMMFAAGVFWVEMYVWKRSRFVACQRTFSIETVDTASPASIDRLVLLRMRDQRERTGLFGSIAAFLLGLIERLIRRLD